MVNHSYRSTMPPCVGYKRTCWFSATPKDPAEKLCVACLRQSDIDKVDEYLKSPAFLTDDHPTLMYTLFSPPFTRALTNTDNTMERILTALLNRSFFDIDTYIRRTFTTPQLCLLIQNHTRSSFCRIYAKLLLKGGVGQFLSFPRRCLRCQHKNMLYGQNRTQFDTFFYSHPFIQVCADSLHWQPDGFNLLVNMVAESPAPYRNHFLTYIPRIFRQANRPETEYPAWMQAYSSHPLLLKTQTTYTREQYSFLKARWRPYKEEFIAATWTPHRLFPWCLDIEELKDFGPMD